MPDSESVAGYRSVKSQFDALLAAAVDGVIVIDSTGAISEFNAAAEKLFGYSRAEVVGKDVAILMPEPMRSAHGRYLRRYLETGDAQIIGVGREVIARRSDGSEFPAWLSVGEAGTEQGTLFVGIVRDVSAQHAARARHAELEARLAHVGRFSLMGEMAGGIAHEINQPLSAIATYSQAGRRLLDSGDFSVAEMRTICGRITEQTHRAASVIENLRGFIRKQEPQRTRLDVNELVRSVLDFVDLDARNAKIDLHLDFSKDLPPIKGNDIQIQQVILNLTRNAVDAMRGSPAIARRSGIIIRTRLNEAGRVCIAVADHGPGVAKGLSEAVFHPFVSTKDDGLGVGLAISKTIVESHDGKIAYRSAPDGGAVFEAEFPAASAEAGADETHAGNGEDL